jgi:PAS domain S-box-containing protein
LPSSLLQSLLKVQAAYVLSDPRQPDCPIVHASPDFLALTGYSREEVEGRNCRFLQVGGSPSQRVCVVHGC